MTRRVVVVGAGLGGLAAAMDLARAGCSVQVLERGASPGGKARTVSPLPGMPGIHAGPTVFTFREVFEQLFADAGTRLSEEVSLHAATVLARHAWRDGSRLDLMADHPASLARIADFAGHRAAGEYGNFCKETAAIHAALRDSFMRRPLRGRSAFLLRLLRDRQRMQNIAAMWRAPPWQTLWQALHTRFSDPRLRQLFARYATYVGSSPLAAPATLMLIAHVEQEGVWLLRGGMRELADAMARVGKRLGAQYHYDTEVRRLIIERAALRGVELADGQTLDCDAVIFNGDSQALAAGLLGEPAKVAVRPTNPQQRALSAVTWCRYAQTSGFELDYHNVFFAEDYAREFRDIFDHRTITERPTVYVCAQDRGFGKPPTGAERLLLLVNAAADGDQDGLGDEPLRVAEQRMSRLLADCGLQMHEPIDAVTRPQDFAALFPGSGGSLYGQANHGAHASFARPAAITSIKGLYLAGGSVHPGPGVPMVTLSGRIAAAECLQGRQ